MASFSVTVAMGQEYLPGRLALAAGPMIGWALAALPLLAAALATALPAPRAAGRRREAVA